jgi:aminoglycoside phosphotransferase (APT) family kinase protein
MFREQLGHHPLDVLPEHQRDPARAALLTAADGNAQASLAAVRGGASGALVHRVDIEGARSLLLRIETARDPFRNPHRSYVCLRTAANAGIAPPVHVADPDAGIVVMDFIHQRPIDQHPGGPAGVLRELGGLVAQLQATPAFPPLLDDFAAVLQQMLAMIDGADVFAPGVLTPVHDGFERIRAAYPWDRDAQVSSHNDVNPFNVLFDGDRLWLIDWEISFRNDRFADVACVANNFADPLALAGSAAADEDALLAAWLGHVPDRPTSSRLALMRQMNRLFYGCLMMSASIGQHPPEVDLAALTVDAFRAEVASGRLALGSPHLLHAMGKMQLAGFLEGLAADGFETAVREAASG